VARRTALLIAFQFPPMRGSSAVQRTLRFAQHLPKFGWTPIVLTATPGAHEQVSSGADSDTGAIAVHRSLALDAARHLSVFGRYPRALAMPDRWVTWKFSAVPAALRLIREQRIDVVWTTFPIATAHAIGLAVARRSGLPWVAEFRDPMWQGDYPPDPRVNRAWKDLERSVFGQARRVIVTTPGAARDYRERFPGFGDRNIHVVENGFDEDAFARAEHRLHARVGDPTARGGRLTLLHSGVIYPSERDPTCLFDAIAKLRKRADPAAGRLQLILRATGNDNQYQRMIDERGIGDLVRLAPAVDYVSALEEMLTVDGLLVLQSANCNAQIPAKIYEYFRAGRPIVALTDAAGDTADILRRADAGLIAPLDSAEAIAAALREFVRRADSGEWQPMGAGAAGSHSREHRTAELAAIFEGLQP
jgi:glycosyltransferase involved in cell wall biosynthesis